LEAGPKHVAGAAPLALADARGFISVPGEDCVKDFAIYLVNDAVRQRVLDQFTQVVKPLLAGGLQVDVVSHSWGTVVAYEALRQMGDDGATQALVRNFFTVGAALSIGPVKMRLRQANQDGRRPANVRRWVNLNALGDVVGGPLKQRPFQVDLDFPNLDPYGCGNFFGIVNPACAHGSYFQAGNLPVNRDIFGAFIESK
jgi:pimeloyl-ACP methyl ester carboxylesterase